VTPLKMPIGCPRRCGWGPADTFLCSGCRKERCYCQGMADQWPELCDECWGAAHAAKDDCLGVAS
jgi:hypothetical protein